MKRIVEHQEWDFHVSDRYIYFEDEKIIGSFTIIKNRSQDSIRMESLYIQPEYRGKGISHILMKDILEIKGDKIMYIVVMECDWVFDFYKKYGFEPGDKKDDIFIWMKLK